MGERKFVKPVPHENPAPARRSHAPYNFIPLPEAVVTATDDAAQLPDHDTYGDTRYPHTGYFDVTLTTRSPLYVRGPVTRLEFERDEQDQDRHGRPLDEQTRYADRVKNTPYFFYSADRLQPVIPGSSLRGMLRSLLEIISYGKLTRLSGQHLVYRGVGDSTALGAWYREQMLGADKAVNPVGIHLDYPSSRLKGGFLCRVNGEWAIRPAKEDVFGNTSVHVEYSRARSIGIGEGGWQTHPVYVTPATVTPSPRPGLRNGKTLTLDLALTSGIANRTPTSTAPSGMEPAVLIESGHMGRPWGQTPNPHQKHMHCAIYEADTTKTPIPIPRWMWEAYVADRDMTRSPRMRTRKLQAEGDPLYYLLDQHNELVFFGSTMMFRLRYRHSIADLIPKDLRPPLAVDYAEALFGFIRSKDDFTEGARLPQQGEKRRAYASRLFVTDARLRRDFAPQELWLKGNARDTLTPPILATPKPTSFQHYLTQPRSDRSELSHYDSPTHDDEGRDRGFKTTIRGHKLYWRQGDKTAEELEAHLPDDADQMVRSQFVRDQQGRWVVKRTSTQHTQFKPLQSGVTFTFRVYFENLSEAELGALCWTLHPQGEAGKTYCHQLGMGKPFGMGAVELNARLHLTDRSQRYRSLFDGAHWLSGAPDEGEDLSVASENGTVSQALAAFEADLQAKLAPFDRPWAGLKRLRRIAALLRMMEWPPPLPTRETAYIPSPQEFKQRRVLPDPLTQATNINDLVRP